MGVEIEVPTRPGSVRFGGYDICAEGFDDATFAAAVDRALGDGLRVEPGRAPRTWLVTNPAHGAEYAANVHGCSCPAGLHGTSCKHVALVLLVETIIGGSDRLGGSRE